MTRTRWSLCSLILAGIALHSAAMAQTAPPGNIPATIRVDASRIQGVLRPIYRFFGADEPNYATMKDGRRLLAELGLLGPQQVYFRTHNLLNTGDGTAALKWGSTNAYTEDPEGRPVYSWSVLDRIFDSYLRNGIRPYAQIGFMPQALSLKPDPYQHEWRPGLPYSEVYTGWTYPPKDYSKWARLVSEWVKHCLAKYGSEELNRWYWEVWNEPNIGYWSGTQDEFFKLHDYAIDAVRSVLPTARVGGPDVAGDGGRFMQDFLEHCLRGSNHANGKTGTPLDFISFHAKGQPRFVENHVQMGIAAQLKTIDAGFARIASFPELRNKPVIIGESDPEGCAACQGPQLAYRNGTMYSSYTAVSFARKLDLAEKHGIRLEGALTWAFEFEDQPYFAGFRALATNGIDLPVLNVFRMFGKMSGQRIQAKSSEAIGLDAILKNGVRDKPDIGALASLDGSVLSVLLWYYHDDDLSGADAAIELELNGLPQNSGSAGLVHYRIDENHSNSYAEWKRLGSPLAPTREQYNRLEQAGRLARLANNIPVEIMEGKTTLSLILPRQGVSLLQFEFKSKNGP